MGGFTTHEYVILGIRLFPDSRIEYDKREELARSLGLSFLTVRRAMTDLKKSGDIMKTKEGDITYFMITEEGMKKAETLHTELGKHFFTIEEHGVPVSIKLLDVLYLIHGPLFRVFLMKLYFERDSFDLMNTLKTFEMLEKETSIYNLFEKIEIFHDSPGMPNFVHSFMDATMFGMDENERMAREGPMMTNIGALLLEADMKLLRGMFKEALSLYNSIIQKPGLPQDLWFIASIGRIKTYGRMGLKEEWEKAFDETRKVTDNRIVHGFLNQMEADLLGITGEHERAKVLFEKAIGTFRYYKYPVFLTIAYNNYGILMFNKEMYSEAERMWLKAKRYAFQSNSRYMWANVATNLASIMRIKGDLVRARKYLENVKMIYNILNTPESLSVVEYNISLIYLSEGKMDKAISLFNRSCFTTFPLLSEFHREERFQVFKREAERHKYTPLRRGPKYDLVYIG
ncbi:MAG: tetratricopeptide repeat protein [Candidatus Thermoplasmatota archaeon]|nr:tetratricopeptide repeat protein [Candidatus Thermoplasmatota archaeon]